MVNGIRASDPHGLNNERGSKFCVGFRVRQETSEESRRIFRSKRCEYNDEDNSHQYSSQKFRHLVPDLLLSENYYPSK